ncbi:hypothetical protein HaLaN_19589, partial [Haematococcus lacustris]
MAAAGMGLDGGQADAVLDPSPDVAALGLSALAPLCQADVALLGEGAWDAEAHGEAAVAA